LIETSPIPGSEKTPVRAKIISASGTTAKIVVKSPIISKSSLFLFCWGIRSIITAAFSSPPSPTFVKTLFSSGNFSACPSIIRTTFIVSSILVP